MLKGGFGLGAGLDAAGIDVSEAIDAVKKKIVS